MKILHSADLADTSLLISITHRVLLKIKSISKKSLICVYMSSVFNAIQDKSSCMSTKAGMQLRMRMPAQSVRAFRMLCMQALSYSVLQSFALYLM